MQQAEPRVCSAVCVQPYVPITWGEAIVWTVMMVVVASAFLVDSGQYVPYIMSLAVKRSNFKLQMDSVLVRHPGLAPSLSMSPHDCLGSTCTCTQAAKQG